VAVSDGDPLKLWIACCVVVVGLGCSGGSRPRRPYDPEALLVGGETCRVASDCATKVCSLGMCMGYLMASTEMARLAMATVIVDAAKDRGLASSLQNLASEVLADHENDRFVRARAADLIGLLPPEIARPGLVKYLDEEDEAIRFFAARGLHRSGDGRGTEVLKSFLGHPSPAVRSLCEAALAGTGGSGRD